MIKLEEQGVTFLGGGVFTPDDLVRAVRIAPNLIAADGAADSAIENGFIPTAVIGDMDSISDDFFRKHLEVLKLDVKEQETTDFDKCLKEVTAKFGIGIGFLGARIDHELAALNSIATHDRYPVLLIGTDDIIVSCPGFLNLNLPSGTRVSLFPLRKILVSTNGLVWNLKDEVLSPLERIGASNVSNLDRVIIENDHKGLLLIIPKLYLSNVLSAIID